MDELIIENEKLIYHVLKQLKMYHLKDDYYDIGMIGLVKATKYFSQDKAKFTTYACRCIRNEILIELRKQTSCKRKAEIISLNKVVFNGEDNEITLADMISSEENIENDLIKEEQLTKLYEMINNLEYKDREIIKDYYGLERTKKNQTYIADKYKLSQAQVSRKINKLINEMRKEVESCYLK